MDFTQKIPSSAQYNKLRENSGMGGRKADEKIKIALEGSLYLVSVYEDDNLIGMGRIIGDGGISFAVSDIMVDKKYQNQGIANKIMNLIDKWFDENTDENSFIMLIANKPADKLYLKHKFYYLGDERLGMLRKN